MCSLEEGGSFAKVLSGSLRPEEVERGERITGTKKSGNLFVVVTGSD
jgi:hypothetical protein